MHLSGYALKHTKHAVVIAIANQVVGTAIPLTIVLPCLVWSSNGMLKTRPSPNRKPLLGERGGGVEDTCPQYFLLLFYTILARIQSTREVLLRKWLH